MLLHSWFSTRSFIRKVCYVDQTRLFRKETNYIKNTQSVMGHLGRHQVARSWTRAAAQIDAGGLNAQDDLYEKIDDLQQADA